MFKTTEHQVRNRATNMVETFFMNNVSAYIKHGMADLLKAKKLSALPDDTPGELMNLQQGTKWKEHWMFQHPVITTSNVYDIGLVMLFLLQIWAHITCWSIDFSPEEMVVIT